MANLKSRSMLNIISTILRLNDRARLKDLHGVPCPKRNISIALLSSILFTFFLVVQVYKAFSLLTPSSFHYIFKIFESLYR